MQNWKKVGFKGKLKDLAARRKLEDLTIGPVLTVSVLPFSQVCKLSGVPLT
jgi:hypothetical protein